jgi:hypothetical protein
MVMSRKGRRRIVVGDKVYWWSYTYWGEFRIAADDRRLILLSLLWGQVRAFRVQGPDVRGLPAGTSTPVVIEDTVEGENVPAYMRDTGPAYVRRVIEWCLDPNVLKRVRSPDPPSSAPDVSANETDFLKPRRPLVSYALAHAKKLLGAPDGSSVLAVPQNPARARGRRRAVIDGLWESLAVAGLLPLPWVSAPERWFAFERSCLSAWDAPWVLPAAQPEVALVARPASVRSAVLIADVVEDMTRVESLAREFCGRARRFGVPCPERVAWWIEGDLRTPPPTHPRPALRVFDGVTDALYALRRDTPELPPGTTRAAQHGEIRRAFDDDRALATAWVMTANEALQTVEGLPIDPLADPFAPLLAIWELGYALLAVDEEAIWLYAKL